MLRGMPRKSCLAATTDAADPGQSPIVLVIFAAFSDSCPTPVSMGNVRNVPPPAKALMALATRAARDIHTAVMTSSLTSVFAG